MYTIDKIGILKEQIKNLEKEVAKLQADIVSDMKAEGKISVAGRQYIGNLSSSKTLQVDSEALLQTVGIHRFMACIKPSVEKIRKELSTPEIEKCAIEIDGVEKFCVKSK